MFYTSRRRKLHDFLKTNNLKYYIVFGFAFIVVFVSIIFIYRSKLSDNNNSTATTAPLAESNSQAESQSEELNAKGRYRISLNKAINQISIFEYDDDNEINSEAVRHIICSHNNIEDGIYKDFTRVAKSGWFANDSDGFYRYVTDMGNGLIFRTATYRELNKRNSLDVQEYSLIGQVTNANGIVMTLADAKWIYENCGLRSDVLVYSDENEVRATDVINTTSIPAGLFWDPSEDISSSPWISTELKSIKPINSTISVPLGSSELTLLSFVKVLDVSDVDYSTKAFITGYYNLNVAGIYNIVYNAVDLYNNHLSASVVLKVIDYSTPTDVSTNDTEDITNASEVNTTTSIPDSTTANEEVTTSENSTTDATMETTSEIIADTTSELSTESTIETTTPYEENTTSIEPTNETTIEETVETSIEE